MNFSYIFSSAQGDVPVDGTMLNRPFLLSPFEVHPFLTLGDFFDAIRDFVPQAIETGRNGFPAEGRKEILRSDEIDGILIRYEKYGALYQIVSAEVSAGDRRAKFAVSAALSTEAKVALDHEFDLLKGLNHRFQLPYLPKVYFKDEVRIQKGDESETLVMTLSEWFEGFHEWHFSKDPGPGDILIWDLEGGYRSASEVEKTEIIRQAAKILSLYYDVGTYQQIHPWHHGAGDFVVKSHEDHIDVRLVSARGYEPVVSSPDGEEIDPVTAVAYFFLNMTIKMRLDKAEGMGDPVWAPSFVLPAVLEGFFEAIRMKESRGESHGVKEKGLFLILRSLSTEVLENRLQELLLSYRRHDPVDAEVVHRHLKEHAQELFRAIQDKTE